MKKSFQKKFKKVFEKVWKNEKKMKKYVPFAPPYYFKKIKKVMSHLRHRTIYKNLPQGPIFINSSIVTEICFSISPLG